MNFQMLLFATAALILITASDLVKGRLGSDHVEYVVSFWFIHLKIVQLMTSAG